MGVVGVPLDQLHCPTCGYQFRDFSLHVDSEEEFALGQYAGPIMERVPWRKYLLCPNGHKWSIKVIWRQRNYPDCVLLDRYLGTVA
jgi:hypothetical protein